jgi:hypothetical protein
VDFGDVVYCGSDGDCAEGLKDQKRDFLLPRLRSERQRQSSLHAHAFETSTVLADRLRRRSLQSSG